MIAMQYTIRLAGDYDLQLLRDRVARRKPLFDGLKGLVHKSYMFSSEQAIYAPFYVWENDDAARAFLISELFSDLVRTFGRPRVRLWSVLEFGGHKDEDEPKLAVRELDIIPAEDDLSELARLEKERHDEALNTEGLCYHLSAIDPDRWEIMRYSVWCDPEKIQKCDADAVECFDILQLCEPERVD